MSLSTILILLSFYHTRVKVSVLFADFADARAGSSPQEEYALIHAEKSSNFFREVSYGRLEVVYEPYFTWLNLPESSMYYKDLLDTNLDGDERTVFEEAVRLAGSNVGFSDTDILVLIMNPQASNGPSGGDSFATYQEDQGIQAGADRIPGGLIIGNVLTDPEIIVTFENHALSRQMGIQLTLMTHGFQDGFLFPDLSAMDRRSATGSFSTMGNARLETNAPGFFAFERWHLGWLDDEQIFCLTEGEQTINLSAVEQPGGTKAVVVPLGQTCALVIESRRATGVDQDLTKAGALVYKVDTSAKPLGAPIRVLPLPATQDDLFRDQAPLAEGESITYSTITVRNIAQGQDGDAVQVTVSGPGECLQDEFKPVARAAVVTPTAIPAAVAVCSLDAIPAPTLADVVLRFVNQSGYQGVGFFQDVTLSPAQDLEYFKVADGGSYDQETYQQDKWVIKEPGGGILLEYSAAADKKQCIRINRPLGNLWLDFVNQSGVPAILYLVGANGNLEEQFTLGNGATLGLWTANGIAWRILDQNGKLLLDYTSTSAANQRVVIPGLSASPTSISVSTNSPVPTATLPTATPTQPLPTATPPVPIVFDANNCPVITGAKKVVCYDVTGSTENELLEAMKTQMPTKELKRSGVLTYMSWNWPGFGTASCDLSSATVSLTELTAYFPRWTPPANASQALINKWNAFTLANIVNAQLWVNFYNDPAQVQKVRSAVQSANCTTAPDAANKAFDAVWQEATAYQKQFGPTYVDPFPQP